MGSLDALFADLLRSDNVHATRAPGDIGDIGDKQALARDFGQPKAGDTLATSGDIGVLPNEVSPNVATLSPTTNRPESKHWRGLSPVSPMSPPTSQGLPPRTQSQSPAPTARIYRLTRSQADEAHREAWGANTIEAFILRRDAFLDRGCDPDDADDLAEQLALRDSRGDEARMCVECTHLGERGRCLAAAAGRLPGVDPRLEPDPTNLRRCVAFGLRKGWT